MEKEVELAIIGGGPAATAAGVYAARKKLNTALIAESFGGQSVVSEDIRNWIGVPSIAGNTLAENFKKHLKEYESDTFQIWENRVNKIEKNGSSFTLTLDNKKTIKAAALFIGTGSNRRTLKVKGADEFEHKGVTYCASCDGPLFANQDVAVIGGGNAGFETAAQLLAYTKSVTLLHRGNKYKADKITVDKVLSKPNMTGVLNATTTEVFGDSFVKGLRYTQNDKEHTLSVTGIFVEIGLIPATDLVKDLVKTDPIGRIEVNPKTQISSNNRIWAAGDCTDGLFHQNNIAAGDAVKAIESAYLALRA